MGTGYSMDRTLTSPLMWQVGKEMGTSVGQGTETLGRAQD